MSTRYRKKPVVIDAVQWTGENTAEVIAFATRNPGTDTELRMIRPNAFDHKLSVETLEGYMNASPGDWIIRGVKGEFYPCKPDIFAATYEQADAPTGKDSP